VKPDPLRNNPSSQAIYEHRRLDTIAARWSAKAATWDSDLEDPACHLNEDHAYGRFLEQLALVIQQRHASCAKQGLIDAGCATGRVLAEVIAHFAWGIGIDISPEMIKFAAAKKLPKARFLVGDCFDLSANCPKAGAIVSRGVLLSHYGHRQAETLLSSARASLVPGGFVFWDFLNGRARGKYQHSPDNKTYFDPEEICGLAIRAGFRTATTPGEPERRAGILLAEGD
jgi:SAM-dependent methyltransferase